MGKRGRPKDYEVRVSSSITQDTWNALDDLRAELGLEGAAPVVRHALEQYVRTRRTERDSARAA